jgi:urea transport system ATP-binding protein
MTATITPDLLSAAAVGLGSAPAEATGPRRAQKPAQDYLLSVSGLTVSFDGFKVIDDLSLAVEPHELRAVIGPNGAGKTTLLDLISGRTRATSGSILFKGEEITRLREHEIVRAGIGRKFQTPSIYETLTVFENLEMSYPAGRSVFGSLAFRRTPAVVSKVEEIAEAIYLADHLHRGADGLSHGQKQWLEIGMLLIQEPELLMLDEPVAGMTPAERRRTAELLKGLSENRALIVIEHDMEFVKNIADRVTVLHQGKWLAEGSMDFVQADPKVIEVYLGH